MTTVTFRLNRVELEAYRTKLAAQGIDIVGDQGKIENIPNHEGIKLDFKFEEPIFMVDIISGGGIPEFIIKHKIQDWFKET